MADGTIQPTGLVSRDLSNARFTMPTHLEHTNFAFNDLSGSTNFQIITSDPRRVGMLIVNTSSGTLYLAFQSNQSPQTSIPISGGGGSISITQWEDGELTSYAIWGGSTTGAMHIQVFATVTT